MKPTWVSTSVSTCSLLGSYPVLGRTLASPGELNSKQQVFRRWPVPTRVPSGLPLHSCWTSRPAMLVTWQSPQHAPGQTGPRSLSPEVAPHARGFAPAGLLPWAHSSRTQPGSLCPRGQLPQHRVTALACAHYSRLRGPATPAPRHPPGRPARRERTHSASKSPKNVPGKVSPQGTKDVDALRET